MSVAVKLEQALAFCPRPLRAIDWEFRVSAEVWRDYDRIVWERNNGVYAFPLSYAGIPLVSDFSFPPGKISLVPRS